eukprot:Partr_v1_DN28753_c0_g1_i4_m63126 putative Conserved hypothetical protein
MSIPARFSASHRSGPPTATVTLDIFLDYVCPYSARAFNRIHTEVIPHFLNASKTNGKTLQIIFRNQIQPWHPQSPILHEASLAIARLAPSKFWKWSKILFDESSEFYDVHTVNLSRFQIVEKLAALASSNDIVPAQDLLELLRVERTESGAMNEGNSITDDLKYFIKFSRQNSIHISPTLMVDGLVDPSFASAWTLDEWIKYLGPKLQ